ncbi:cathepsin W [Elgaria multicarinata webbii]|uniref:cathepsin W n=1 Tax=Elgaria multicarinata webbii TaxID=159646 RepID=UPI002FCCDB4C
MGPASLPACLMVLWWGWVFAPPGQAILPPDLSMTQLSQMFQEFMIQFNKTYQSQEERHHRFSVFAQNLEMSRALQASELGTATYGVTKFSDLTEGEFALMLGASPRSSPPPRQKQGRIPRRGPRPHSCDWRKHGAITAVKHQGSWCRSCWAFAAVSNIEALWNIHRHAPRNLSVQEVVDCVRGGDGCKGGYTWDAFLAVMKQGGLMKDKVGPGDDVDDDGNTFYPAYDDGEHACRSKKGAAAAQILDFEILPRDEEEIANVVASHGPVTAIIYWNPLQHYQNGIVKIKECDGTAWPDHAVLIVGYGEENPHRPGAKNYWIIQNSWGTNWGEKGYFRLHRGSNACSIAKFPVTARVT